VPSIGLISYSPFIEHLTKITLLVSLVGAGLKIDRRMGVRQWKDAWFLLGVGMPLSIIALSFCKPPIISGNLN
jgi:hypothetical protein